MSAVRTLKSFEIAALEQKLGRVPTDRRRVQGHLIQMLDTPKDHYEAKNKSFYDRSVFLNQPGNQCTGFSTTHMHIDGPITNKLADPFGFAMSLYEEAKKNDEWPGENYEGSSVRGAAEALRQRGGIQRYLWAFTLQDMVDAIMRPPKEGGGAVVCGTDWYYSMFQADKTGLINIDESSGIAGGHAYEINAISVSRGAYMKKRLFRGKNSWSQEWGLDGRFWITFEDMEKLIHAQGEVMSAIENKVKLKIAA